MRRTIFVKFSKEGIHKYPAALTDPALKEVEFLGHPHRHIFHFEVEIDITHADRDIEFILFKRWLESLYANDLQLDYKSCEMIADDLWIKIQCKYPNRSCMIQVTEDDENGSRSYYKPGD